MKETKRCLICKVVKVASEFHKSKINSDELYGYCKNCQNAYNREWQAKHREYVNALKRARYKRDPQARKAHYSRTRISRIIKGQRRFDKYIVECGAGSRDEFMRHLKSTMPEGYTLADYGTRTYHGKLCVDHIKPCADFDLTNKEQEKICNNYLNLRLIPKELNSKKSDK